jgi:hypothetical protein
MDEIPCKEGWQWTTDWILDIKRAVDSKGYEYADEADLGSYGPVERNYHLARRRLWERVRERTAAETKVGWVQFEVGFGFGLTSPSHGSFKFRFLYV